VAVVVAGMVLANVVLLLMGRDGDRDGGKAPRAGEGPRPTVSGPPSTSAGAPDTGGAPGASSASSPAPPGDGPPNHAGNNSWKQRPELSAEEQASGDELAARIRPRLEALRAAGDLAPASTRQALLDLGISQDAITVESMRQPPGAVFAVRFGDRGCIVGDVRPERVLVQVEGAAAEYGCLEPFTH
jgi:hypothetical protein